MGTMGSYEIILLGIDPWYGLSLTCERCKRQKEESKSPPVVIINLSSEIVMHLQSQSHRE